MGSPTLSPDLRQWKDTSRASEGTPCIPAFRRRRHSIPRPRLSSLHRVFDSHWDVAGLGKRSARGTSKSLGPTEQPFRRRTEPAGAEHSGTSGKSKSISHGCKTVIMISSISKRCLKKGNNKIGKILGDFFQSGYSPCLQRDYSNVILSFNVFANRISVYPWSQYKDISFKW